MSASFRGFKRGRRRSEMPKQQYKVKGETFEVDDRYEVKKKIGAGAYGVLCAAIDKKENIMVAIKKIKDAFDDAIDCKRTLREVRLMQHFTHENVLNLRDIMLPPPGQIVEWKDIYLVLELMDTDLHYIIHSKQALMDDHIQYFIYQILRGLKAIHSAKVLHRDLKPNNLLVNQNCDLKICDFGLARGVDEVAETGFTEYVVTRWYRAPELLVENQTYDSGIDIWSVGCILAECLGRKALLPGKDYLQQLRLIIETLGEPSASDLAIIENPQAVEYIKALPKKPKVPFGALYPQANPAAIDLLEKMLVFDPSKRISAAQALEHQYLHALHNVNDEPSAPTFDFSYESSETTETDLRKLIWDQLRKYHTELGAMPASFAVLDGGGGDGGGVTRAGSSQRPSASGRIDESLADDDNSPADASKLWEALRSGEVVLVRLSYVRRLATLGHLLPKRQDLEPSAIISAEELEIIHRSVDPGIHGRRAAVEVPQHAVPIAVVSHMWATHDHPDPDGTTLSAILAAFDQPDFFQSRSGQPFFSEVGLFFDYSSLYQRLRTDREQLVFDAALGNMSMWYAHPLTTVILLTADRPGLTLSYHARGWPTYEFFMARAVKPTDETCAYWEKTYDVSAGVPCAPKAPTAFAALLQARTFTNGADKDTVTQLYSKTLSEHYARVQTLRFVSRDWSACEAMDLARALLECGAPHLLDLCLRNNPRIGDEGVSALATVFEAGALPRLKSLSLSLCGIGQPGFSKLCAALATGKTPMLSQLSLYGNHLITSKEPLKEAIMSGALPNLDLSIADEP